MAQSLELNVAQPISSMLKVGKDLHRNYESIYQVYTKRGASPYVAYTATGIPLYGTVYAWDPLNNDIWSFCKGHDVELIGEIKDPINDTLIRNLWQVTVLHTSEEDENESDTQRDDPTLNPPVIHASFLPNQRSVSRDKNGDPIVNTAKKLYVPSPQIEESTGVIRVSYNTRGVDLQQWAEMRNKVNEKKFWKLPARQVKLKQWDWRKMYAGNKFPYIRHSFSFEVSYKETPTDENFVAIGKANPKLTDKKGFYTVLPNAGVVYYENGVIVKENQRTKNEKGETFVKPVALEANGDLRDPNLDLLFNIYELEEEADFNDITGMPAYLPGVTL